jgi:hypothetical protein
MSALLVRIYKIVQYFDLHKHNVDKLALAVNQCDWSDVTNCNDLDTAFVAFLSTAHRLIEEIFLLTK